ncbi:MAG: hypothetical protein HYX92_17745 [Chloroflexi bacterium]|nr:hypothetical protein [Chloroflexota bacterium]
MAEIEVMNPVAEVRPKGVTPAPRLDTLDGKKIALWWNTKSNGDVALTAAAEAIQRHFKNVTFERFTLQLGLATGPYDAVRSGGFDAVIASTGD